MSEAADAAEEVARSSLSIVITLLRAALRNVRNVTVVTAGVTLVVAVWLFCGRGDDKAWVYGAMTNWKNTATDVESLS